MAGQLHLATDSQWAPEVARESGGASTWPDGSAQPLPGSAWGGGQLEEARSMPVHLGAGRWGLCGPVGGAFSTRK